MTWEMSVEDAVHIKEILISGPEVTYEWKSDGSDREVLQQNVEKFAGIGGGDSKSSGGESSLSGSDEGGKKLIIDRIILREGKVSVSADSAFLKGKKLNAPLPNIELKDIGKEEGGASAGDVIAKVMDAMTGPAGKELGSLGIGELTKSLGGLILIIGILTAFAVLTVPTVQAAEPKAFRDCADCPEMVIVPAGASFIGSPQSVTQLEGVPAKRSNRERPVHRIRIAKAFGIGKFEVTRHQYGHFVSAAGYRKSGGCKYWTGDKFETADSKNWQDPGYTQGDQHPAVCISWDDAKAYTNWLASKTDKPYRLPSEAEWEYAARAGAGTPRFWGSAPKDACGFANVFDLTGARSGDFPTMAPHKCNDGYEQTAPVGSFQANGFGLHDTAGNAWEWTEDCWHQTLAGAPNDGSPWVADGRCTQRVLRGGSWISIARFVRSGNRSKINTDARVYRNGFRIALSLPR